MNGTLERFWSRVDRSAGPAGCWLWQGRVNNHGYGVVWLAGPSRMWYAHRLAYTLIRKPIPDGLELDHRCRVTRCVNPAHLEPVTHRENVLRGVSPAAELARQTHCHNGHPFDEQNTYLPARGGRQCRRCRADAESARMRRKAAVA